MKLIDGLRDDDIFLLLDADELPTAEALLFLKLFDGWREPVRFGFRWTVFGFFWLKAADPGWLESLPLVDQLVQLVGGGRWGLLSSVKLNGLNRPPSPLGVLLIKCMKL